jgi:hypothetical protein
MEMLHVTCAGVVSADEPFTILEGADLTEFLENLDEGIYVYYIVYSAANITEWVILSPWQQFLYPPFCQYATAHFAVVTMRSLLASQAARRDEHAKLPRQTLRLQLRPK